MNAYALVCFCLAVVMLFGGLEFKSISSNVYAKRASLQTADLFLVTGTITSYETNGKTARVFINDTPYRAEVIPSDAMQIIENGIGYAAEAYIVTGTNQIGLLNIGGTPVVKLEYYKSYLNKRAMIISFAFLICVVNALYYLVYGAICLSRASKKRKPQASSLPV